MRSCRAARSLLPWFRSSTYWTWRRMTSSRERSPEPSGRHYLPRGSRVRCGGQGRRDGSRRRKLPAAPLPARWPARAHCPPRDAAIAAPGRPGPALPGGAGNARRYVPAAAWAMGAMSSRRARSGGIANRTAVRRKARSGRSCPWPAIWRSGVWEEATSMARPGARSCRFFNTASSSPCPGGASRSTRSR